MRPRIYEITITGQADSTLRAEFDDCTITIGPDTTTLHAETPDPAALYGLLERITGLGLELTHLHLVRQPCAATTDPGQRLGRLDGEPTAVVSATPAPGRDHGPGDSRQQQAASPGPPGGLEEPLTAREQVVLQLLATPLSFNEIGQQMGVSRDTVKGHSRAINRKLGSSNRHEAVQRGRELAILRRPRALSKTASWVRPGPMTA